MNSFWKNLALILTIFGGFNWGLVGAFDFNLISFIFGSMSIVSRILYVMVGIASISVLFVPLYSSDDILEQKTF